MCIMEEQIRERLAIGMNRYGHGVIVDSDTRAWGTPKNSWIDMAVEEFLDAVIYVVADYIRKGRESEQVMCDLEIDYRMNDEFIETTDPIKYLMEHQEPDDNGLIMHIIKNHNKIESARHRMLVENLIKMLYTPPCHVL